MGKRYDDWTVPQLQFALREKGLSASGKKRVLIDRLKNQSPIQPCAICNKEFTWTTLEKYGGSVCGKCFKSKTCRCKICDVEKKVSDMFIVGQENFCGICYTPTILSYSVYLIPLIYLFIQSFLGFIVLSICLAYMVYMGLDEKKTIGNTNTEGGLFEYLKNVHNYTIGPTNVRKSSMFILVLAIILCIILAWTLASPWFLYTVTYEHAYSANDAWKDHQGEAFTHEHYLGYVRVDIAEPLEAGEVNWKTQFL